MKRDCIHGQLARSFEICERDTEIATLKAEVARMRPVFNAVKRCISAEGWIMNGEHIACKPDAVRRLEDAYARAARKAKGKR